MGAEHAGHQEHPEPARGRPAPRWCQVGTQVLLEAAPLRRRQGTVALESKSGRYLVAAPGTIIMCKELWEAYPWHRIAAVNGIAGDAKKMVEELCTGTSEIVTLHLKSGWMLNGATVVITDLVAGYADFRVDVLKGVNFVIERKTGWPSPAPRAAASPPCCSVSSTCWSPKAKRSSSSRWTPRRSA